MSDTKGIIYSITLINLFVKRSKKNNITPCVRLNGTSDLPYENYKFDDGLNIFESFNDVQFYDYTVINKRMTKYLNGGLPSNYHLTYSRKEDNQFQVIEALQNGANVSVVFEKHLPKTWNGYEVINGDKHDLRFLDKSLLIPNHLSSGKTLAKQFLVGTNSKPFKINSFSYF